MQGTNFEPITKKIDATISMAENINDGGITISDSKARLVYKNHIEKKGTINDVLSVLGIFITTLITLLTVDFKDVLGENSKYVLQAIFIIVCILSAFATLVRTILWLRGRKKYTEDNFIEELKGKK